MRAVITGGGTGGHLFPGIALAGVLKARLPESRIIFIVTNRSLDQKALAGTDVEVVSLTSSGLKGLGPLHQLKSILGQPVALLRAVRILRAFDPDFVFGVGGYVTGPVLLAAKLLGIPTALHEQNSVPGLANRLAGRFVDRIYTSLPCKPNFPQAKTLCTGNPVRVEILAAGREKRRFMTGDTPHLLVLGGSQGAHFLNECMSRALSLLQGEGLKIQVKHQTGRQDEAMVRSLYAEAGIAAEVSPFIADMAAVYAWADFVVSRAGATSLAELAVMGLPALLVPYPFAADNHQAINAAYYAAGGGALFCEEKTLSPEILAARIKQLLADDTKLAQMGAAMRAKARPDATERLVDACLELAQRGRQRN